MKHPPSLITPAMAARLRRDRGSALLMVVVVLFMLAIMGTAYLQYARIQRFAAGTSNGDIDAVINAAVSQIKGVLAEDITYNDKFAPYDYPWTNPVLPTTPRKATLFDGSQVTVPGGNLDDYWLADSSPVYSTTTNSLVWSHLTNLEGVYLRWNNNTGEFLDSGNATITAGNLPHEDLVSNVTNVNTYDTDGEIELPISPTAMTPMAPASTLVDADGDGIPDSRWTWAPIRQINGITYVMAVRIVDLSSLVNVNSALGVTDINEAMDVTALGDNAPHWDTPSEINLGSFLYGMGIDAGDSGANMTELDKMLGYRFGNALGSPIGLTGGPIAWQAGRRDFGKRINSIYPGRNPQSPILTATPAFAAPFVAGSPSLIYGVDDEYNLRRFNGINDNTKTAGALETTDTGLPTFLQTTAAQTPWASPSAPEILQHFGMETMVIPTVNPTPPASPTTKHGRRNSVTLFGGANTLAAPIDITSTTPIFKLNLNSTAPTASADIAARITEVYDFPTSTPTLPASINNTTELGDRLAACIATYRRNDNQVANVSTFYGLTALPFITEVYAQRYYTQTAAIENPPSSGTYDVTWLAGGTAGYAIEIGNPFAKPIKLDNVSLWINGVEVMSNIATVTSIATIAPGESIIIKRDATGAGANNDVQATFFNTFPSARVYTAAAIDWPNTAGNFAIELRCKKDDGSAIPFGYQKFTAEGLTDTQVQSGVGGTPPFGPGYRQVGATGNGQGIKMLTVTSVSKLTNEPNQPYKDGTASYVAVGTADKTTVGGPNGPLGAGPVDQQVILSGKDFDQVGELMHLAILGFIYDPVTPANCKTVPEYWGTQTSVNNFMLDFDAATAPLMDATATDPTSAYHVPHAQFLLDQFTTLDPTTDGIDNDGDGLIDDLDTDGGEHVVPGLVNLNTMPLQLLERVLPIPDPATRSTVAQAIVGYRTGLYRPTNARTAKGIAFTGELQGLVDPNLGTPVSDILGGAAAVDNPTMTSPAGPVKIDFLSNASTAPYADSVKQDREEKATIARWLSQVGSARSDHFVAYIWVRGYSSNDLSSTGLQETKRAMVVFRRNFKTVSGSPKIEIEAILPANKTFVVNQ